jgi:hypothetical protein
VNAMDVLQKTKIVPQTNKATKQDIEHTVTAADRNDAQKLFFIGRNRLIDVNKWNHLCGSGSINFILTDTDGNRMERTAEKNDLIKVDTTTPIEHDSQSEWVQIEDVEDKSDTDGPFESITLHVSPAPSFDIKGEIISHFHDGEATTCFTLTRKNNVVTATVQGRNKKLTDNNSTDHVAGAFEKISNTDWKNFLNGLIAMEK